MSLTVSGRLEVPETELFEALQLHRRFMVKWLVEQRRINALSGFNSVLRSCHHQLSALGRSSPRDVEKRSMSNLHELYITIHIYTLSDTVLFLLF